MSPKYDWLVDDVQNRLPAAGMEDLADALRAALRSPTSRGCGEAEALARRHREPRIEVFAIFMDVLKGLTERGDSCEGLLDRALFLVARTIEVGLDPGEERICHYDMVLELLYLVDLPGHAADIEALVDDLDARLPKGETCRTCILPSRARVRESMGDFDAAEAIHADLFAQATESKKRAYRLLSLAALAARRGRHEEAERLHGRAVAEAETLEKPDQDLSRSVGTTRVHLTLARGGCDEAAAQCEALRARTETWRDELIAADLALATKLAEVRRTDEAVRAAERCARNAEARGMRRAHAEARLLAAEGLLAAGRHDEARPHVEAIGRVVGSLRSRDLDARAEAVGARIAFTSKGDGDHLES